MIIEITLIGTSILIAGIFAISGWWIGQYNKFQIGIQDIKTQWSNILTEYQRRADLYLNLTKTVKSYKKFEKSTLVQVIEARNGNFGKNQSNQIKRLKDLDKTFSKLIVLFERYPKLQSNEQHNKLMEEIRVTEDRINIARTDYNEIVGDYNKMVVTFPSKIIAEKYKIKQERFFENEPKTNKAPKIELGD